MATSRTSYSRRSARLTSSARSLRCSSENSSPAFAAPLAVSYSTFLPISSENYFGRVDYQVNAKNNVSVRMLLDPNRVDGQMHVLEKRTISAMRIERVPTPGELFLNGQWVRVMGNRRITAYPSLGRTACRVS